EAGASRTVKTRRGRRAVGVYRSGREAARSITGRMRRLAAALALAAILFPLGAAAAEEAAVARLPSDPAAPASLFRPTVLSGVFRVPRVDTSLYVAAPWLARDLSVVI